MIYITLLWLTFIEKLLREIKFQIFLMKIFQFINNIVSFDYKHLVFLIISSNFFLNFNIIKKLITKQYEDFTQA